MTDKEKKGETEESSWNLATLLIQEIGGLLSEASRHYIALDYGKSFFCLSAIRNRISANLLPEEIKELKVLERQIKLSVARSRPIGFETTVTIAKETNILTEKFGEYNDKLMGYLKKYGYLIPPKEDKTKMNA